MRLYGDIIADQLKRGFVEQVDESQIPEQYHFIPHHLVKKDSATAPMSIVYDCGCRQGPNQSSLNDCLQAGPPFINDLCELLIRFHAHKISIVTVPLRPSCHLSLPLINLTKGLVYAVKILLNGFKRAVQQYCCIHVVDGWLGSGCQRR